MLNQRNFVEEPLVMTLEEAFKTATRFLESDIVRAQPFSVKPLTIIAGGQGSWLVSCEYSLREGRTERAVVMIDANGKVTGFSKA
jgi:hypothetical protein